MLPRALKGKKFGPFGPKEEIYSSADVIRWLQISKATFYRMVKAKQLTGFHVGSRWRFTGLELERVANSHGLYVEGARPYPRADTPALPTPRHALPDSTDKPLSNGHHRGRPRKG